MSNPSNSWWAQAVQNRLVAMVLAMVVIVTLLASPVNSSVNGIAAIAFEALAILLFATLIWRARWNFDRQKIGAFLRTGPNLPVLLFLGAVVVSCLMSPVKLFSAQEALRVAAGVLLYFVVAYQFRRSEHLSKLFDTLLFVGIAASVFGFVQFGFGESTRAAGPFGNPQLLASFLMVLLPIVTVVALSEKKAGRQLAAQVAAVLMAACLLLTQTRSAWLGTAMGLVVLASLAIYVGVRSQRHGLAARKHELVLPVMLLVAVGVFLVLWPQTSTFLNRATSLANARTDTTWQWRQDAARDALGMFRAHPLSGVGIGMYPIAKNGGLMLRPSLSDDPHNLWLKLLAEMGLPGLLLMVATIASFLFVGLRRAVGMDPGIRRSLLLGSIASVVAFSVDALSNPSWSLAQTSMFFWLVMGLGVGALRPFVRQREQAVQSVLAPRFMRPVGVLASLALAVFVLPSALQAVTNTSYLTSITLQPGNTTIRGGTALPLHVIAHYSNGFPDEDVTNLATFGVTYGSGPPNGILSGEGTSNVAYNSKWRENEDVTVTASYGGQTNMIVITVHYP